MKRMLLLVTVAAMMAVMMVVAGPASAQGGGCKAFGQNVATLAQDLGVVFGQFASSSAPVNDTVEQEQGTLC